jgi:hypothetical protein
MSRRGGGLTNGRQSDPEEGTAGPDHPFWKTVRGEIETPPPRADFAHQAASSSQPPPLRRV